MSEERLLPCPFCGGEAYINYETMVDERTIYWAQVLCKQCHARSCGSWRNSYTNAEKKEVKAWNTRKPMERIVEKLEERVSAHERIMLGCANVEERHLHCRISDEYRQAIEIVKG